MIAGFSRERVDLGEVALSVHMGGTGDPLVLLHGYPQNHACWARVAPEFATGFQVIVPDLRGYGDSEAPADDADHLTYSKRRMAQDIVRLLDRLGHRRAMVLGHDRGARVAYRMALDFPDKVTKIGIIEVVPTGDFWGLWNAEIAMAAYHWTFLAQPAPLPERMIGADPDAYVDWTLRSWTKEKALDVFDPQALAGYRAQARDPARIAAMCADYRAGATVDRQLDEADRAAGRKIAAPLHFVWAEAGFPARTGDPLGLWRNWADKVTGHPIPDCGHFAMEENPLAVTRAFMPFFRKEAEQ